MIIVPEDLHPGSKKMGQESRTRVQREETEFSDPPPSYSEGPGPPPLASTSTSSQIPNPNIKPSNFVYLSNTNSKIRGKWVVDPALVIPRDFLPPLSSGETELTRKNLSLKSTNGLIDADVFVLPTSADAIAAKRLRERVLIHASSTNGRIQMNIHDSGTRLPLEISADTTNGHVDLSIPRSFNGPLRTKLGNGRLHYSNAVGAMITTFSDVQGVRRSYLGPLDTSHMDRDTKWEGDELYAQSSNGDINICFDDEVDQSDSSSSNPFFNFWPFS
jgi:hypothetical protein